MCKDRIAGWGKAIDGHAQWFAMRLAVLITFSIACSLIAALWSEHPSVDSWIRVVTLLVSWPVLGAVIVLALAQRFHKAIDVSIRELLKKSKVQVKTPWLEVLSQQQPTTEPNQTNEQKLQQSNNEKALQKSLESLKTEHEDLAQNWNILLEDLNEQRELNSDQAAMLSGYQQSIDSLVDKYESQLGAYREQISQITTNALSWRHQYLDLFFVDNTKRVLAWFTQNPSCTREMFDLTWEQWIPQPTERENILVVLAHHGLVTNESGLLQLTEDGRMFTTIFWSQWVNKALAGWGGGTSTQ